jgi:hypothetical protein
MLKTYKNKSGFTLVEFLITLVFLIIIVIAGFVVYKHERISALPVAAYSSSDASEWLPYTDNKGGFGAYFPTKPNYNKTPTASAPIHKYIDGVNTEANIVESSNGAENSTYGVTYIKFPGSAEIPSLCSGSNIKDVRSILLSKTTIEGKLAETYECTLTIKSQTINALGHSMVLPSLTVSEYGEYIVDGDILLNVFAQHHPDNSIAYYAKYFVNSFKIIAPSTKLTAIPQPPNSYSSSTFIASDELPTKSTLIFSKSGTNNSTTQSFTTKTNWSLVYNYDCSNNANNSGNFVANVISSNDSTPSESTGQQSGLGSGSNEFNDNGSHYIDIKSNCNWTVDVTVSK